MDQKGLNCAESRLLKVAASFGEMEVQRAGSGSYSQLYGQKFEDLCLARVEKRRKTGSNFAAGSGSRIFNRLWKKTECVANLQSRLCVLQLALRRKQNVQNLAKPDAEMVSRLCKAGSRKLSRLS
ncbi:hypothetical protein SLEP1_g17243 [Rubroshorea leprosula]|uniref:Uncharacterized protein n=1 Tax=Rubroshorea leprosula TaxID=152421 RepID=A0AAV5IZ54_9ROSI|nr:hypothetical protein SLEP1_g17243 [Rubroshorea leprosula]